MKMNNETIWQDAEKLAQLINEARVYIESHDGSWEKMWEGKNALKSIKSITNCDKQKFIGMCTQISKFMPKSDYLHKIAQDVMSLRQESFSEDKDISFEMFLALAKFHVECVKPNWK